MFTHISFDFMRYYDILSDYSCAYWGNIYIYMMQWGEGMVIALISIIVLYYFFLHFYSTGHEEISCSCICVERLEGSWFVQRDKG